MVSRVQVVIVLSLYLLHASGTYPHKKVFNEMTIQLKKIARALRDAGKHIKVSKFVINPI